MSVWIESMVSKIENTNVTIRGINQIILRGLAIDEFPEDKLETRYRWSILSGTSFHITKLWHQWHENSRSHYSNLYAMRMISKLISSFVVYFWSCLFRYRSCMIAVNSTSHIVQTVNPRLPLTLSKGSDQSEAWTKKPKEYFWSAVGTFDVHAECKSSTSTYVWLCWRPFS